MNMSRILNKHLLWWPILAGTLAACSTGRNSAPVVERTPYAGSRPAEGVRSGAPARPVGRGYYTVRRGDSLLRIAQQYGQSLRDLVNWNNLANANDIRVDQVLRVLPPDGSGPMAGTSSGTVGNNGG